MSQNTALNREKKPFFPGWLQEQIKEAGARDVISIADRLLLSEYPFKKRTGNGYQYSRKSGGRTWIVTTTGPFAGWSKDWRGKNLDASGLVQEATGRTYPEALEWLAGHCGVEIPDRSKLSVTEQERREREWQEKSARREEKRRVEQERQERITEAAHDAAASVARDIAGRLPTGLPSHPYAACKGISFCSAPLFSGEDIHARLYNPAKGEWQDNARAIAAGSLVIPMQDATSSIVNLQAIRTDGQKRFIMGGAKKGAFHVIPGIEPGYLVEGFATGCTVAEATGRAVFVAFDAGNLVPVSIAVGRRAIAVAADNDEAGIRKAEETGLIVAAPPAAGDDWNDHAARAGIEDTRRRLALSVPPPPTPRPDADTCAAEMKQHLAQMSLRAKTYRERYPEGFRDALMTALEAGTNAPDLPPVSFLNPSAGVGKTTAAIDWAIEAIRSGEAGKIVIAQPNHKLTGETHARAQEMASAYGIRVAVWRGRGAANPEATSEMPGDGSMCWDPTGRNAIESAGLSVSEYLCDGKGGAPCPFRETCPYMRQRRTEAQIWIVPHNLVFAHMAPPQPLMRADFLVIDEDFTGATLKGVEGRPTRPADLLVPASGYSITGLIGQEIQHHRAKLVEALQGETGPRLSRASLERAGIAEETARRGLELDNLTAQRLKPETVEDALRDDGETKRRRADAKQAEASCRYWRALLDMFTQDAPEAHRIHIQAKSAKHPETGEDIRVNSCRALGRARVSDYWKVPTVIMDATGEPELIRHAFPNVEVMGDGRASAPYQRLHFIRTIGGHRRLSFSKSNIQSAISEGQFASRQGPVWAMLEMAWKHHHRSGGAPGLLICPKVAEEELLRSERLPPTIRTAHFGNLVGLNEFEAFRYALIFGRSLPSPFALEANADAISDSYRERSAEKHASPIERETVLKTLPDGRPVKVPVYRCADPLLDALKRAICDGGTEQAIARLRGVRRTAVNPCDVFVFADCFPESAELTSVADWQDVKPGPVETQFALGCIAYTAPAHASMAYPEIWPGKDAAKKAFQRAREENELGDKLLKYSSYNSLSPSSDVRVSYQLAGRGTRSCQAIPPPGMTEDEAREAIESALGAIKTWEWLAGTAPAQEPSLKADAHGLEDMDAIPADMPPEVVEVWPFLPPENRQAFLSGSLKLRQSRLTPAMAADALTLAVRVANDPDRESAARASCAFAAACVLDICAACGSTSHDFAEAVAEAPPHYAAAISQWAPWIKAGMFGSGLRFLVQTYRPRGPSVRPVITRHPGELS